MTLLDQFFKANAPFDSAEYAEQIRLYRAMLRTAQLIDSELTKLGAACKLSEISELLPSSSLAVLTTLHATFQISQERDPQLLSALQDGSSFDSALTERATTVVCMGWTTVAVLKGYASDIDPTETAHEILLDSARRVDAIINELMNVLSRSYEQALRMMGI